MKVILIIVISLLVNISSEAEIQISIKPRGIYKPGNTVPEVHVEKFQILYLICEVVNSDKSQSIIWYHNGELIKVPPPYSLSWKNGKVLYVRPVVRGHTDGLFTCNVGSASKSVRVVVKHVLPKGFPRVVTSPADVHTERKRIDFRCIVTGDPPFTIRWFRNSLPLHEDEIHKVLPTFENYSNGKKFYTSNLVVYDTKKVERGFYRCVVSNGIGQVVSKEASIRFKDKLLKKRKKRFAEIQIGNCAGDTDDKGIPDQVDIKTVRSACYYNKDIGWYFDIQWQNPEGIQKYPATYYVVVLSPNDYSDTQICFRHNDTTDPSFRYDTAIRDMQTDMDYHVAILAQPSAVESTNDYKYIGKCSPDTTKTTRTTTAPKTAPKTEASMSSKPKRKNVIIIVSAVSSVVFVVFFGVLVLVWYRRKEEERDFPEGIPIDIRKTVYVSYAQFSRKEEDRIKLLAHCLNNCGIKVHMDMLYQVELCEMGGFAHWIPAKIEASDKVLLVLNKSYLKVKQILAVCMKKALKMIDNTEDEFDPSVRKTNAEYTYIRNKLYETGYRSGVVLLLDENVSKDEVPHDLVGFTHVDLVLPKSFSPEDKCIHKLALVLEGTEPLQLRAQNT